MAESSVVKEGFLEKRQRGLKHPNTDKLKFQQRYFILNNEFVRYYKNKPQKSSAVPKGMISIDRIKIIEEVHQDEFRKEFCFQIGDQEEVMYLACSSLDDRTDWIKEFVQVCSKTEMLPNYHCGVYSRQKKKWSCCQALKFSNGCTPKSEPLSAPGVIRRTRVKGDRSSKRKLNESKADFDSGYSSRNNSMDSAESEDRNKGSWGAMQHLQHFVPPLPQGIIAMKFMAEGILVIALNDCSVQMYDIPSNAVIHKICLAHPISSIDVWRGYLLIGSSLVHLVDTRQGNKWKRMVVVDVEEKGTLQNPSQHLAVFNGSTGQFVTMNREVNKLLFWDQPTDNNSGLITKPLHKIECTGKVLSLKSVKDIIFVLQCQQTKHYEVHMFQWSSKERTLLRTIPFSTVDVHVSVSEDGEYLYLLADGKGIQELSVNTRDVASIVNSDSDEITCFGESCLHKADNYLLFIGFASGKVEIRDTHSQGPATFLLPKESPGAVVSIACKQDSNLVAVATENGRLTVWGGSEKVLGKEKTPLELLEISKFSIYKPATFSRHSILTDAFNFVADSRGGRFVNRPSYSLKIPRGAIREREEVNIHTGIILCAGSNRFKVPGNYQVVSPIVWFCRDRDEEFQEPVTIELQHCAQYGQCLTVLKAKCSDLSDVFVFEPQGEVQPQGDYATFQTKHFCIYCYGIVTEVPQRICVVPVEGAYVGQRKEVTFCFCYFLDGCLRAISEQYKDCSNHCNPPIELRLRDNEESIEAMCNSRSAAIISHNKVQVEELNFINMTDTDLALAHEHKTYPPRISYNIDGTSEERVTFILNALERQIFTYEVVSKLVAAATADNPSIEEVMPGSSEMSGDHYREPSFYPFSGNSE